MRLARLATTIASGAALLVALSACQEEVVALATIPADDAGTHARPQRCLSKEGCPDGFYCEKRGCEVSAGICVPYPAFCDATEEPVCGCEGITYFNDCLRRAAGSWGSTPETCGELSVQCRNDEDCGPTAVCARLLGFEDSQSCEESPLGTCWVVPLTCPPLGSGNNNLWKECFKDRPPCTDACSAIRTGRVHARASKCAP